MNMQGAQKVISYFQWVLTSFWDKIESCSFLQHCEKYLVSRMFIHWHVRWAIDMHEQTAVPRHYYDWRIVQAVNVDTCAFVTCEEIWLSDTHHHVYIYILAIHWLNNKISMNSAYPIYQQLSSYIYRTSYDRQYVSSLFGFI